MRSQMPTAIRTRPTMLRPTVMRGEVFISVPSAVAVGPVSSEVDQVPDAGSADQESGKGEPPPDSSALEGRVEAHRSADEPEADDEYRVENTLEVVNRAKRSRIILVISHL